MIPTKGASAFLKGCNPPTPHSLRKVWCTTNTRSEFLLSDSCCCTTCVWPIEGAEKSFTVAHLPLSRAVNCTEAVPGRWDLLVPPALVTPWDTRSARLLDMMISPVSYPGRACTFWKLRPFEQQNLELLLTKTNLRTVRCFTCEKRKHVHKAYTLPLLSRQSLRVWNARLHECGITCEVSVRNFGKCRFTRSRHSWVWFKSSPRA